MQRSPLFVLLAVLALTSGCGGLPLGPKVVSLELDSSVSSGGRLTLVRDKPSEVSFKGRNSAGALVELDPRQLACSSSDEGTLKVEQYGTSADLTGLKDWFDANDGREPSAEVIVTYGETSARFPADVVLNASGKWNVLVDLRQDTITLSQTGRKLTHLLSQSAGEIQGKALTLTVGTMTMQGNFTSRNEVQGQYLAADGSVGVWQAQR